MKSLRRSLNNNNPGSSFPAPPIPPHANPLARPSERVAPPQKVIKALQSHRSTNPQELSYTQGDFWYVTGEREGWYEALSRCSPSSGVVRSTSVRRRSNHGLEGIRTEDRIRGVHQGWAEHGADGTTRIDRGEAVGSRSVQRGCPLIFDVTGHRHPRKATRQYGAILAPPQYRHFHRLARTARERLDNRTSRMGAYKEGADRRSVYAIVQYDFVAERPDELDAKKGEPIVVIAQSNHEWYVEWSCLAALTERSTGSSPSRSGG